jgi:hypothetical protein
MSEGITLETGRFSVDSWHNYCKGRWIGIEEIRIPSGEELKIPLSSADLNVEEFNEYMQNVEVFAATCGVWLDDVSEKLIKRLEATPVYEGEYREVA